MKKIAKKVFGKSIKNLNVDNFVITGVSGVASENLTNLVGDILEQNPDALEVDSKIISIIEDFMMGCIDFVDDIPIVNNLAKAGLEGFKTFGKETIYPVNILNEVDKNVFNKDKL
ncbi:hypothetical protein CWO85_00415 [Candidatus Phytoplasma ziziphi]|uniref:Uncharacterized protein n=1 Tax=Ziziphus jujuba witches'-broom phytoplasma TaxID=135727 RepID=A0A660HMJ3_ZIZJU|nr:hypothetical protein [Candidatus Phytoplasma ziziphi]AYJ01006.1 hypothetical protein CWO85_00415 [Candidatus Phytoplasma ziziphi]